MSKTHIQCVHDSWTPYVHIGGTASEKQTPPETYPPIELYSCVYYNYPLLPQNRLADSPVSQNTHTELYENV